MGVSRRSGEGRDIKSARVCGVYVLTIRELGNDGFAGWTHVGDGGSGHEKMTCCARVQDGQCLYGIHVNIDSP
jgi:hypothetical protein